MGKEKIYFPNWIAGATLSEIKRDKRLLWILNIPILKIYTLPCASYQPWGGGFGDYIFVNYYSNKFIYQKRPENLYTEYTVLNVYLSNTKWKMILYHSIWNFMHHLQFTFVHL